MLVALVERPEDVTRRADEGHCPHVREAEADRQLVEVLRAPYPSCPPVLRALLLHVVLTSTCLRAPGVRRRNRQRRYEGARGVRESPGELQDTGPVRVAPSSPTLGQ